MGALDPIGVRPTIKLPSVCEIVKHKSSTGFKDSKSVPKGLMVDQTPISLTIDSGACDSVCPPSSFPNTILNPKNKEQGRCYGACGGETVRNIGSKEFKCLTGSGETHNCIFQVGDRITKPLLAVSKICETGKSVCFRTGANI